MTFTIQPDELVKVRAFKVKHLHNDKPIGLIGGNFTYSFTPTSIGAVLVVKCGGCGEYLDVTDYGSW